MIMDSKEKEKIWKDILARVCGCYVDEVGNRPCDWGAPCDKCSDESVIKLYKKLTEG